MPITSVEGSGDILLIPRECKPPAIFYVDVHFVEIARAEKP
jgi:hypothetical protein